MDRNELINRVTEPGFNCEILVIGGGATGLGAALEAASRGYKTLLLEQHDFAKGTSSRSTKLVHGGVRYLAQGNISLVLEALRERGRLRKNAPHLVRDQAFIIPCYKWWCIPFYTIGLTLYDLMAGRRGIGRSLPVSRKKTQQALPGIKKEGLRGGVRYYDGQFDDARLAVNLFQSVLDQGGTAINYMPVTALEMDEHQQITGVKARDLESDKVVTISAKVVINATGVFVDRILKMEDPGARELVKPSQGIHLVMDSRFLNGREALMIPKTSDGRVLFAVPWHNRVVVGTTDVEKHEALLEPLPEPEEVDYILETAGRFMEKPPERGDVKSVFAGLRPLAAPSGEGKKTKEISRGHKIMVSPAGLVTITGGKWTTYRQMGEDVVDRAERTAGYSKRTSVTRSLGIHGYQKEAERSDPYFWYGSEREEMEKLVTGEPRLGEMISDELHIRIVQVVWAVRMEMARTLEDFLSRRTRALQLDARESIRIAPDVARIMARELQKGEEWERDQVKSFKRLAGQHLLS